MTTRKIARVLALVLLAAAPCLAKKPDNQGKEPRILLKQDFAPGKYNLVQTTVSEVKVTMGPDTPPQLVKTTQEMKADLDVSKPDAQGTKKVQMSFSSIKVTAPGMSYDSADPDSATSPVAKIYGPMLKAKIVMEIDKDGKLLSMKGLDAVWDEMAKNEPDMKDFVAKMKKQMGDQMMNQMLGSANKMMIQKPVGVGAVWHTQVTQDMPMVGKTTVDSECELQEFKKAGAGQVAVIDFTADVKSAGGEDMGMANMPMKITRMDLKQTGRITMDVDSGVVSENLIKQKGQVVMSVGKGDDQKMEFTTDIDSTITTTITPVK